MVGSSGCLRYGRPGIGFSGYQGRCGPLVAESGPVPPRVLQLRHAADRDQDLFIDGTFVVELVPVVEAGALDLRGLLLVNVHMWSSFLIQQSTFIGRGHLRVELRVRDVRRQVAWVRAAVLLLRYHQLVWQID